MRARLAAGRPLYAVDQASLSCARTCSSRRPLRGLRGHARNVGAMELCRKQIVALRAGTVDGILDEFAQGAAVIVRNLWLRTQ